MRKKRPHVFQVLLASASLLIVIGLSACPPPERYEGTYVEVESENSNHPAIVELKDGSEGIYQNQEQEVSFRWSVKGREIRFHTKEGGIVLGEINNDTLTVTLPTGRVMTFKKKPAY